MQDLLRKAFVEPMQRLGDQLGQVLPSLVIVIVVLVVGGAVAWLVRQVVYGLLQAVKFDRLAAKSGLTSAVERTSLFKSPSDFAARVAQGLIWVFVILFALNAAGTQMTQTLVARFVGYIPDMLTAALVLLLGAAVSKFLARSALLAAVNAQWGAARLLAGGVRILVMALTVVVALEQLRIGRSALLLAFGILFAGIVIAAAIAFGFGARDMARDWLESKRAPKEREDEEAFRHL